jgi:hypothetical protein
MDTILCSIVTFAFDLAQFMLDFLFTMAPSLGAEAPNLHDLIGSFFGCNT